MSNTGFFGFEMDGDVKLIGLDSTHESFAPHYLDWVRDVDREELLRLVGSLRVLPKDSDKDKLARAFGYESYKSFLELVGDSPESMLSEANGSPKDMLYNGVAFGSTKPSDLRDADYGYVANLGQGTIDCYIGNQLTHHGEGLFFAVEPTVDTGSRAEFMEVTSLDVFPPRLYASYDWDALPPKSEFLEQHYRAVGIQDEINRVAVNSVHHKPKSIMSDFFRRSPDVTTCGIIVASTGQPCRLKKDHRGRCRSIWI